MRIVLLTLLLLAIFGGLVLFLGWNPHVAMWAVATGAIAVSVIGILVLTMVADDPREVLMAYTETDRRRAAWILMVWRGLKAWWRR